MTLFHFDTNALLNIYIDGIIPETALLEQLQDPTNRLAASSTCFWEIAIKTSRENSDFNVDAQAVLNECVRDGISPIHISPDLAIKAAQLPLHHKDPFDRLIIASAMEEGATILTSDTIFIDYNVRSLRIT